MIERRPTGKLLSPLQGAWPVSIGPIPSAMISRSAASAFSISAAANAARKTVTSAFSVTSVAFQ